MNEHVLNIALIDDDEDDRSIFEEAIEEIEIETQLSLFENGQELLDYLNSENCILPRLIFLDLNMPVKNGLQCLKEIRADNKLDEVMIAIYSTSSSMKDMDDTFAEGANLYLRKPDSFRKLTEMIEKVLHINWSKHLTNLNRDNFIYR